MGILEKKKKGKKLPQQGCGNQIMMEPWTITPRPSNKRTTWLPCSSFLVFIANMPSPPDADDAKQTHPQRRCSEMSCQCHTVFCQTSKKEKFQSRGQKEGGEKNPQRNQIPPLLLKKIQNTPIVGYCCHEYWFCHLTITRVRTSIISMQLKPLKRLISNGSGV